MHARHTTSAAEALTAGQHPAGELRDEFAPAEVTASETAFRGYVWDVLRETFSLPESEEPLTRDFVQHTGAVAVAAIDAQDRILLIQQYRHPVLCRDWEIPAGLLDVPGEEPLHAAQRELGEEADLHAGQWHLLADQLSTPGGVSETLRIFTARELSAVPEAERHLRDGEENGIVPVWIPLTEAVEAVLAGRITNGTAALAILHAEHARTRGWENMRPADEPWPARDVQLRTRGTRTRTGPVTDGS
ncbi:NUDIX domain-containing protein [Brevibacterium gallinarum]|uniref:NUDIX hydrolase n=1 Tax=Brevibacterium gallinarum TaxID=2762220 RepID=A0ABR8WWT0_9MICO|nr:NUDIX hydrolase [Brevibacterium gallinarum]MBD8021459.1 NUDIX hydrolase [Brevibacterium gallinarum]